MAVVKFTSYFIMPVHGLHCHVLIVFELLAILCEYTRDEIFTKTFKSCFIFTNDGIKTFHCIAVVSKNIFMSKDIFAIILSQRQKSIAKFMKISSLEIPPTVDWEYFGVKEISSESLFYEI